MNKPKSKPAGSTPLIVVIILVVVIIAAGVGYYFYNQNKEASNNNANQAAGNTNSQSVNGTSSTNAPVDTGVVWYRSPEFGYLVRYNDFNDTRTTTATSNSAANLYSEWSVADGETTVIKIQVFPLDKRTDVFSARQYATTEEAKSFNGIAGNVLTVGGVKRGYAFEHGSYLFVLQSDAELGTSAAAEFETIAGTLVF